MLQDNLIYLRNLRGMTQENLAVKIGVSRQTIAKWEAGKSTPDLKKSLLLAEALETTLDNLIAYNPKEHWGAPIPPKGKHIFGVVTVDEKGQIVIPPKARVVFRIDAGDQLVVLGDESQGLALVKPDGFLAIADAVRRVAPTLES